MKTKTETLKTRKARAPGFATTCIHAGQEPEPLTGAVAVPIFQTSTFIQEGFGKPRQG
jgi:O-acetylhomoserine/O-acetylserine sulfhydrylase-like pyridoxal-dependent enzyme